MREARARSSEAWKVDYRERQDVKRSEERVKLLRSHQSFRLETTVLVLVVNMLPFKSHMPSYYDNNIDQEKK